MRLLIFLVLGTLIFGLAFPAFILMAGLLLLIFAIITIFSMFGGKRVIIYQNGRRVYNIGKRKDRRSTADNPEVITSDDYAGNKDTYDFGEQAEPEIIELPPSALRKDSNGEEQDN